jgi:RNA polymerase sigma factor (sigma-70 family)
MTPASVKLLRTQSDERLAALAAVGHERAFEAIVERYRRPLLRHCRKYLPEARAEDALQQALVSAWSGLRRGDDVRELRPWLHRIVHNTSLNALRASGYDYEQLRDTLEGDGGPAELAERAAVIRQALAGLAALPERQREALLQIAVEGRTQDEVAEDLGLSHGAVRQLVHRARSRLRTAATALTPLPLAGWLASGGDSRGDLVARVAELVAGAGGGATLAKAGAVAAVAGSAVGAPVVIDGAGDRPAVLEQRSAIAAPAKADEDRADQDAAEGAPVAVAEEEQEPAAGEPAAGSSASPGGGDAARGGDERPGGSGGDDSDDRSRSGGGDDSDDDEDGGSSGGGDDEDADSDDEGDRDSGGGSSDGGGDDGSGSGGDDNDSDEEGSGGGGGGGDSAGDGDDDGDDSAGGTGLAGGGGSSGGGGSADGGDDDGDDSAGGTGLVEGGDDNGLEPVDDGSPAPAPLSTADLELPAQAQLPDDDSDD